MRPMGWTMLYLFVFLKLPIIAACLLIWWAIRQEPDYEDSDGGGGYRRPHPAPKLPHAPRRGPHREAALPAGRSLKGVPTGAADAASGSPIRPRTSPPIRRLRRPKTWRWNHDCEACDVNVGMANSHCVSMAVSSLTLFT